MKKKFLLISFILLSIHIFSQVPSNCVAPSNLISAYQEDVKDLALKRIRDIHSADTSKIIIPTIYQDTIWRGLAAIFNALSIPARDSVFDIYCIHNFSTFHKVIYKAINVGVNPSYTWTHPWANLITTTGNIPLDNLLAAYGFTVTYYFNGIDIATLRTTQVINAFPLRDSIATFSGVNYAELDGGAGDENYITYTMVGNEQFFDFSLGWGDCPSGCTSSCIWQFKVDYSTCIVYYLGSTSGGPDPWPLPINCNLTLATNTTNVEEVPMKLFPNPTTDKLIVQNQRPLQIEVTDVTGRVIKFFSNPQQNQLIDLNEFSKGMYLIKVMTSSGIKSEKIILE